MGKVVAIGFAAAALVIGLVCLVLYLRWAGGHTRRRTFAAIAVLLCLALVLAGGGMTLREYLQYQKSADSYRHIQSAAMGNEEDGTPASSIPLPGSAPPVDFDVLGAINPDISVWLVCEGTEINYPVVQGTDNTKYLTTLFDGGSGKAGCLFVDFENNPDFSDQNTVIYGHNLLDGSMLSSIVQYGEPGYSELYPTMTLHTPDGSYTVELFAGYTAPPTSNALAPDSPWALEWEDEAAFSAWLEKAQTRSVFDSDVEVSTGDRVITLSTCTNGGRDRFVLHGKLAMDA